MASGQQRNPTLAPRKPPLRRQPPALDCLDSIKTTATPTLVSIARLALLELATRVGVTERSHESFLRSVFDVRLCPFQLATDEQTGESVRRETTAGYIWTRLSGAGYGD